MADDHDSSSIPLELVLEPAHGRQVEVVGRLVQDQELRWRGQGRGQGHPLGLATREGADLRLDLLAHREAIKHRFGLPAWTDDLADGARAEVGDLL